MISKDSIGKKIVHRLKNDKRMLSVYLLGSIVNGNFRDNSDVDVAILLKPGNSLKPMELLELGNSLSIDIGRTVDLGIISSNNLIYASEVFYTGELIYTNSEEDNYLYRANLLGMYVNFNDERKEVLDAYRTR